MADALGADAQARTLASFSDPTHLRLVSLERRLAEVKADAHRLRQQRQTLLEENHRLTAQNKHLAGALERATTGQTDPVSLRLGLPPTDTSGQTPPDLDEMRRLVKARAERGCVAASVWLHDMQWILDALADSIPLRPQHRGELDRMPDQTSTEDA